MQPVINTCKSIMQSPERCKESWKSQSGNKSIASSVFFSYVASEQLLRIFSCMCVLLYVHIRHVYIFMHTYIIYIYTVQMQLVLLCYASYIDNLRLSEFKTSSHYSRFLQRMTAILCNAEWCMVMKHVS